jgi:CheY-like chemotaxis protein
MANPFQCFFTYAFAEIILLCTIAAMQKRLAAHVGRKRRVVCDSQPLKGVRVLVAEDEPLLALDIACALKDAGATVVGPALRVERALELAVAERLSCGILDVNLRNALVFPVADALRQKGVGIVFYTSEGDSDGLRREWPFAQVLSKPARAGALVSAISTACCCALSNLA